MAVSFFTQTSTGLRQLIFSAASGTEPASPERLESCARTMLRLVPRNNVDDLDNDDDWESPAQYPRMEIICFSREVIQFWLQEVRHLARRNRMPATDLPMPSFPLGSSIIATFCRLSYLSTVFCRSKSSWTTSMALFISIENCGEGISGRTTGTGGPGASLQMEVT